MAKSVFKIPTSLDRSFLDHEIALAGGGWQMLYSSATTLAGFRTASHIYLSRIGEAYFAAPQVFYFEPHGLWYLIYQDGTFGAAYATTTNIADPNSWSGPRSLGISGNLGWDYYVICDSATCYLYNSPSDGSRRIFVRRTAIGSFPTGWGASSVAITDTFEGVNVYRSLADGQYYLVVEDLLDNRYYELWRSSSAGGPWTKVAEKWAWHGNLVYNAERWTTSVSHGEFIRAGVNQRLEINDINRVDFLIQGTTQLSCCPYQQIPWDLGMIRNYTSGYWHAFGYMAGVNVQYQTFGLYRYFFDVFGMMLIGMGLFRLGVLTLERRRHVYLAMLVGGYAVGLVTNAIETNHIMDSGFTAIAFAEVSTTYDLGRLAKGEEVARQILEHAGGKNLFKSALSAGILSGVLGIKEHVNEQLETEYRNLHVCDTSVLPGSVGAMVEYAERDRRVLRLLDWARLERDDPGDDAGSDDPETAEQVQAVSAAQASGAIDPSWHPADLLAIIGALGTAWLLAPGCDRTKESAAPADAAALQEIAAERLARFKVPETIEIVDALPQSLTGKVVRRVLRTSDAPADRGGGS